MRTLPANIEHTAQGGGNGLEPVRTGGAEVQIYAKGLRSPDKLHRLGRELEDLHLPGLRYKVDAPHDLVFLQSDHHEFPLEKIHRVFRRLGLPAHVVTPARTPPADGTPAFPEKKETATPLRQRKREPLPDPEELPLHVRNVAALRGLKFTYAQIGRHYGITPQAASVLLSRQRFLLRDRLDNSELKGLSPRAVNCLGRLRIRTRDAARRHPDLSEKLRAQRNCGHKTIEEILAWAAAG